MRRPVVDRRRTVPQARDACAEGGVGAGAAGARTADERAAGEIRRAEPRDGVAQCDALRVRIGIAQRDDRRDPFADDPAAPDDDGAVGLVAAADRLVAQRERPRRGLDDRGIDRRLRGRERRTQVVNDVATDPRYVQPPSGIAVTAELAVPILHSGRPLGVVNVEGDRPFTAVDVQLLELVADHLAVAIENTRLFAQERRLAVLEERQRLARDLHDSVTQLLFSSTLLAESLPGLLRKGIEEAAPKLERLIELNRRALGEMRGLLRELAPGGSGADFSSRELPAPAMVMLHRHGLVEALRTELATIAAQGLATRLEASTYERQSREREEMLLRVAQEALANIVKHAGAREVSVRVASLAGEVVLTVEDDGRGFDARSAVRGDAAQERRDGGMGLASMRDRIRGLFGQLIVESAPGLGTTVEARLPR